MGKVDKASVDNDYIMNLQKQADELSEAKKMLERRNKEIMTELNLASEFQKSMLPKEFPNDLPLTFSHKYIPFLTVGGDFYDYILLDDHTIGLVISDASGHGVASAFLTAMFKSAFTHIAPNRYSPAEVLSLLNKEFCHTIHTDHYITAFYTIIDINTLECTYCNAGHPKQILYRNDHTFEELGTLGFFIGMFDKTEYEDKTAKLFPGDKLCLFTDGILETQDDSGEQFNRERIIEILNTFPDINPDDLSNLLILRLIEFMKGSSFNDDVTFFMTEVMESL